MKNLNKSISIIGCGWLGFPLGRELVREHWQVKGSTTSESKLKTLKLAGIEPLIIRLPTTERIDPKIFKTQFLIIDIPPGRNNLDAINSYAEIISQILMNAKEHKLIEKVFFISSTSVYGKALKTYNESSDIYPDGESGKAIVAAEQLIINSGIPYLILRFGGLAGPGRHPGRFLKKWKEIKLRDQSINYLHLDDAIGVIKYLISHKIDTEIFNVVAPYHPTKKEFYGKMAQSIGLEPPVFSYPPFPEKRIISVDKLLNKTDYKFIYPDPMTFEF